MPLLYEHPLGSPLDGTQLNNNFALLEGGLVDQGSYVVSGLEFVAGTGLAVDVDPGVANIGGRVTVADPFEVSGLTPSDVNYVFLLQDGTGTSNTTGTPPALSVLLGTATTDGTGVTAVDLTGASGRQQFVGVQSHIHGGTAGNPRAIDLSQWHATNEYGNEVFGVLPAGAVPPVAGVTVGTETGTAGITDIYTLADATGGAFTLTLPTAVGITGVVYTVKKIDATANAVTVDTTGGQTIDGGADAEITGPETALGFLSDGANWRIV